jgi:CheY-like chemotaxis protein
MLDSLGHRATVVDNGRLALQAITTGSYDVILMDCHMPEMDGFTATRAIRLWERAQSHRASLPIIALTANVTEDNRERCLAVGMNDFLEKPFTQEQLHLLLWRLLGKTTTTPPSLLPATQPTEPAGPTRQTTVHLDPKALANIRVLQRPGAPNVLDKIIQVYLTTTPSLLAQLRDAIAQEDAELVERSAHTLKSSSASLGANELAALSKELELLGRARTFTQAARLMTAIEELYPAVSAALLVEQGKHHF